MLVSRNIEGLNKNCVIVDDEAGGMMATEYLIKTGHRRIAHITGPLGCAECHGDYANTDLDTFMAAQICEGVRRASRRDNYKTHRLARCTTVFMI